MFVNAFIVTDDDWDPTDADEENSKIPSLSYDESRNVFISPHLRVSTPHLRVSTPHLRGLSTSHEWIDSSLEEIIVNPH